MKTTCVENVRAAGTGSWPKYYAHNFKIPSTNQIFIWCSCDAKPTDILFPQQKRYSKSMRRIRWSHVYGFFALTSRSRSSSRSSSIEGSLPCWCWCTGNAILKMPFATNNRRKDSIGSSFCGGGGGWKTQIVGSSWLRRSNSSTASGTVAAILRRNRSIISGCCVWWLLCVVVCSLVCFRCENAANH